MLNLMTLLCLLAGVPGGGPNAGAPVRSLSCRVEFSFASPGGTPGALTARVWSNRSGGFRIVVESLLGQDRDGKRFHFFTDKVGMAWMLSGDGQLHTYQPFLERTETKTLPQHPPATTILEQVYGTGDMPDVVSYLSAMVVLQGEQPKDAKRTAVGVVETYVLGSPVMPLPGITVAQMRTTRSGGDRRIERIECLNGDGKVVIDTRFSDFMVRPGGKVVALTSTTTIQPRDVTLSYPVTVQQGGQVQKQALTARQSIAGRSIIRRYVWNDEHQLALPESVTQRGDDGTLIHATFHDYRFSEMEEEQGQATGR